jgi:hypothetical protein
MREIVSKATYAENKPAISILYNINIITHQSQHYLFWSFWMFVWPKNQIFITIPPLEAEIQLDDIFLCE